MTYSSAFVCFLFVCTAGCNIALIVVARRFWHSGDVYLLLYAALLAASYLSLCGLYQTLSYPACRITSRSLRRLLSELSEARPVIKMSISGCNLFQMDASGTFSRVEQHIHEQRYAYHRVRDCSDDVDSIEECRCGIAELTLHLTIRCGDEATHEHYVKSREALIEQRTRASTQKYASSVQFVRTDGKAMSNRYLGSGFVATGKTITFWVL